MPEKSIDEIIEAFDLYDGVYKQNEVDDAVRLRDEITPHLIGIFKDILSAPVQYISEGHDAHLYALILLGHFNETKAHKLLIDVLSLPEDIIEELFGMMISSTIPGVLYQTCGGSVAAMRELVLNKKASVYARTTALEAMVYAVGGGSADRREVLDFFSTLFTGSEAEEGSIFWSGVAMCISRLYPKELMKIIDKAYKKGLLKEDIIAPVDFDLALSAGEESVLDALREEMSAAMPDDIHEYMMQLDLAMREEEGDSDSA